MKTASKSPAEIANAITGIFYKYLDEPGAQELLADTLKDFVIDTAVKQSITTYSDVGVLSENVPIKTGAMEGVSRDFLIMQDNYLKDIKNGRIHKAEGWLRFNQDIEQYFKILMERGLKFRLEELKMFVSKTFSEEYKNDEKENEDNERSAEIINFPKINSR